MTEKYYFQELDEDTRRYLLAARQSEGKSMPGVFVPVSNYLPIVGLIVGIILIAVILFATMPSMDDPTPVAMIQTAGIMLGGWMIVAACRVWIAQSGSRYLGHFIYVDALRLYQASGSKLVITPIDQARGAKCEDNVKDGNYQNSVVNIGLPDGACTLTISHLGKAHQLSHFINALVHMRHDPSSEYRSQSAAMMGIVARNISQDKPIPNNLSEKAANLKFPTLPEPKRERAAPQGLVACLVILIVGALVFLLFQSINLPMRDDAIFDMVKTRRPPLLRAYLIDPRNTKHRAEVERKLVGFYMPVIMKMKNQAKDPELGRGMQALLESLKTAEQPLITIRLKELVDKNNGAFPALVVQARERSFKTALADGLLRAIGTDMIAFVEPLDKTAAHFEISYQLSPSPANPSNFQLQWTLAIRTKPDDKPVVNQSGTSAQSYPEASIRLSVEDQARWFLAALGAT